MYDKALLHFQFISQNKKANIREPYWEHNENFGNLMGTHWEQTPKNPNPLHFPPPSKPKTQKEKN
jgi:hypothetical protein